MKIQPVTPPATIAELAKQCAAHDAGFEALQLQRQREIYAALYQRMQAALRLDDEGYEVSITLRSASQTLTLSASESEDCFDIGELYSVLGKSLNRLQTKILATLLKVENGEPLGSHEGTDAPLLYQALTLCLPQNAPTHAAPASLPVAHAA